jgi:putative PEP-CTERM system histidine kinase
MAFKFILAAAAAIAVAGFAAVTGARSGRYNLLLPGLLLLGCERILAGLAVSSVVPSEVFWWQTLRMAVTALLPAIWIPFSLVYGRALAEGSRRRGWWLGGGASVLGLSLVLVPLGQLFRELPLFDSERGVWILPLGLRGYLLHILLILCFTAVVTNLERTLRSSLGRVRWQIKFAVLGLGGFFGVRIFASSQALLFRAWTSDLEGLISWSLVAAAGLLVISLRRSSGFALQIYVSETALRGSITVLAVGAYLVGVGFVAQALRTFGWSEEIRDVVVFLAVLAVLAVVLSDRTRQDFRRWTRLHFRRPTHDYRQIWTRFSQGVADHFDETEIARTVVRLISDTLETLSVSLWLWDPTSRRLRLKESTGLTQAEAASPELQTLADQLVGARGLIEVDLGDGGDRERSYTMDARAIPPRVRYLLPLRHKDDLLGAITLGERVRYKPLSPEDRELLEVLGDQTAALLMNLRLARRLTEASEMQAFQHMSAFFLHDLKNLASRLSLTVQNFPRHYDNPEFREDALRTISQSVDKIRSMCSRLSLIRDEAALEFQTIDLAQWVASVLAELKPGLGNRLAAELAPAGQVELDPGEFRKVLQNLVLNAQEALQSANWKPGSEPGEESAAAGQGENAPPIVVRTRPVDGWAVLEVQDRGCGMSREFVEERLFQPFQTTKPQGMGIGLFQSRHIVERHGGRIEVDSTPGMGTSFRVLLRQRSANG